jgi:hypothetical protein
MARGWSGEHFTQDPSGNAEFTRIRSNTINFLRMRCWEWTQTLNKSVPAKTGPSITRSEKRPLVEDDLGGWRNSLVEVFLRKGPNYGVFR